MGEGSEKDGPILHVVVIGFHHKKGCQVEYSYPPLISGGEAVSTECPAGWKYLPTLALPDGSHNYDKDTVFFHLPGLESPHQTVFGISCFRQIPVEKLKNRTSDITRGTVQKAVCVLSKLPLYGHIQVKMELITHAYFDEGDFTKVSLLEDTYRNLNSCLNQIDDLHSAPQLYVGLSARDLILNLRHKALLLYKLMLLEKRVLFFQSPVQPLCSAILSLLSLHPFMIEKGLQQSACFRPSRPMSPVPQFAESPWRQTEEPEIANEAKEVTNCINDKEEAIPEKTVETKQINIESLNSDLNKNGLKEINCNPCKNEVINNKLIDSNKSESINDINEKSADRNCVITSPNLSNCANRINGRIDCIDENNDVEGELKNENFKSELNEYEVDGTNETAINGGESDVVIGSMSRDPSSIDLLGNAGIQNSLMTIAQVDAESCGLPLPVFKNGYLCLPYLSLPYMDVLTDSNIRGYLLGATNVLFKQKRNLADIVIELESGIIECSDPEIKRTLTLSTEDLRFGEFLFRQVSLTSTKYDVYTDGVGWEGGEDWIRAQFQAYTLCLLRTSLLQEGSKEIDQFNRFYIAALQESESYKEWRADPKSQNVLDINPGHPFAGQVSVVKDMKLKIEHTMQTTEGGRKLNQAMVSTGRAVATTGKAVGGALIQARGALSNWWSNLTTAQQGLEPAAVEKAMEADQADEEKGKEDDKEKLDEDIKEKIEEGVELVEETQQQVPLVQ